MWIPVPFPDGKRLAFKYDADRELVEIQERGVKHTFDLRTLREEAAQQAAVAPPANRFDGRWLDPPDPHDL